MNSNPRLHSVLLTLWDIARDNPGYNRKLWGELQQLLSQLEHRNNVLCAVLVDLLRCTDASGEVCWEKSATFSPPEGYAVDFLREELKREKRPQLPYPPPVIPHEELVDTYDNSMKETRATPRPSLTRPPLTDIEEYDVDDESEDELAFEIDLDSSDELI